MSIRAEKQLAVLKHQFAKLQNEHQKCKEAIVELKKDKEECEKKCKEFEAKLNAKQKVTRKRVIKKKEDDK
jgi:peptidoglycan hydrolase CwlO-like protein